MKNLITRTITGIVFVTLIIGSILFSHESFAIVFGIITILGLYEFYHLCETDGIKPMKYYGIFVGTTLFVLISLFSMNLIDKKLLLIIFPLIFLVFIFELYKKSEKPFTNISYTIFGIFYIALPLSLLNFIAKPNFNLGEYQYAVLLGFFLLIWIYDTGAYVFGSLLGRHKLFERVSPKKSWEGSIGGSLACIALAYALSIFYPEIKMVDWIVVSIIIIIFGTFGDLVESLFKRSINCKDSGTIFPGHGGVLDRFDAVLLAAPFVFSYLELIKL
ncbi:MAG: phosphatidate cytidylyltransferase [Bacteroidetes bacterium]|nr:phosphatidate cytidylyltransferase [Bacteroidota bacterium]